MVRRLCSKYLATNISVASLRAEHFTILILRVLDYDELVSASLEPLFDTIRTFEN